MKEKSTKMRKKSSLVNKIPWILVVLVVFVAFGVFLLSGSNSKSSSGGIGGNPDYFTVRRDNMPISVTEGGEIKAVNSRDIRSEVEGRTTIISIVAEGTYITAEDVNNGKVLVELDSSDIKEKLVQREISFLNVEASYAEAIESLDIRKKQNESDIKAGQMKVKFGRMDFEKYMGQAVANEIMDRIDEDPNSSIDTQVYLKHQQLGGEALQKLRDLETDIYLKRQELEQAKSRLEWTEKLHEKEYVSLSDLEADRLKKEREQVSLEKANTAKKLFEDYGFPKEAEKLLSDYREAELELERIEARARAKLAQDQAKLNSSEASYRVQKERLEKMQKQLKACTIRAPAQGQVVYSSSTDRWMSRNRPIEVGAEIYERHKIISIPDMTQVKAEIRIHEMWVDKVNPGQTASITVSAFPDKIFTGKVLKKAPLADPEHWSNPDLKVYATDVAIDGTYAFLKTGMTAKVRILIDELSDVLIVPIQCVINQQGTKVCYVAADDGPERREVETGQFNRDFVEIKSGLSEGEKVLLNPPDVVETEAVVE